MKLYNSLGPNPRKVRMFLKEKGLDIEFVEYDMLLGAENRKKDYLDKNPGGQIPALELDDGTVIGETVVICEYLEEHYPEPALIGSTPQERADHRQWQRRIELNITEHLYNAFRYSVGIDIFKERMTVIPEAVEGLSTIVQTKLKWLDAQMEDKDFITGKDMKLVDIILYCALDFGAGVNQTIPTELNNINAWFEKMHNRESAKSTYHADSEKTKMRGI